MNIREILSLGQVLPVIVLDRVEDAVPLARKLVAKNVRALEITLRTPVALECVKAIRDAVPEAVVGVGTITNPAQLEAARKAGAQFAVSPGLTPSLLSLLSSRGPQRPRDLLESASDFPFLPGVMTPSDVMSALDAGFDTMKLFPAVPAGGLALLKALAGPFPQVKFCPTGGIDEKNMHEFLALPNVICVGGSWLAK